MNSIAPVALLLVFAAAGARAQVPGGRPPAAPPPAGTGEVRGVVVDGQSDAPVARASVALRSRRDSSLVTGAIANDRGVFRIQGLRPGAYFARVTFIGFAPKIVDVVITAEAPVANLGSVKLAAVGVELSGITVTEQRGTVTVEPDRNAYKSRDVAPAATNASEVLDAVPAVQVDGEGKVSLRGNENVAIQINGRPAPIRGAQLGAYLKGIPANMLDRVEVIPNPSAKFDPEGMAGIINIVLKDNVDLGVSAGLTASFSQPDRYNASGTFGYQEGKLTTFSSAGFNTDARPIVGINDRERYDAVGRLTGITAQDFDGHLGNNGQRFTTTVDYRLNARDLLSNSFSFNRREGKDRSTSAYTERDGGGAVLDRYLRPRSNAVRGYVVDYTLALKRTLAPRKHELSGELRATRNQDRDETLMWRQPSASAASVELQQDSTNAATNQLNAQLDYVRPVGKSSKLEAGYKGTGRFLDRDFSVNKDSMGTGGWRRSPLSNAFAFDELVNAAYLVMSHPVSKRVETQAGLRAEYASRDFSLAGTSYPHRYTSLFPSGALMFNKSAATQLKASYSRRIRRPGTMELNPFPTFFDAQNVFVGNPRLNPEYTDAIELGLTRNTKYGMVQLSPFYRHTSDIIRVNINTADVIDGREVTSVSFQNLATSSSWGTDVNGQLRLGQKFNGFAGFNVFKMVTDGGSTSSLASNAVTWMGRVNATTQLTNTLTFQGSYFYRAPTKIERGEFARQHMANFSLRQKLNGDKATVTLRVSDPFNTGAFRIRAGDDRVVQVTERNFGQRMAFLTFQFNYGQAPKVREPRQEQPQETGARFP